MIHVLAVAERNLKTAMGRINKSSFSFSLFFKKFESKTAMGRVLKFIAFLLNFIYTIAGIITALITGIKSFHLDTNNFALIFNVKNFWWEFGYMKGSRAMTIGHTILIGPKEMENDLAHELIHVEQYTKYPFIFPVLYYWELVKNGYRKNKFEDEAYERSSSYYSGRWE